MRRWRFYRTKAGREIVKKELMDLGTEGHAAVVDAMKRHRRGELMPYEEEHIDKDLHAIRVFHDDMTYRVLYAYEGSGDQILLALHALTKKDRKLPRRAKKLAEKRLSEWRAAGR